MGKLWVFEYWKMGCNGSGPIGRFVTSHSLIRYALAKEKTNQLTICINLSKTIFLMHKATYNLKRRWCDDINIFELLSSCKIRKNN